MVFPLIALGNRSGRTNENNRQEGRHRIANERNLGKEKYQPVTEPFGNFHAGPLVPALFGLPLMHSGGMPRSRMAAEQEEPFTGVTVSNRLTLAKPRSVSLARIL